METHKIDPNKLSRSAHYSPEILEDMKALTWLCSRGWTCTIPGKGKNIGWKPSEEQMEALERLAKYPFDNDELSLANREHLAELVSQLKKLM